MVAEYKMRHCTLRKPRIELSQAFAHGFCLPVRVQRQHDHRQMNLVKISSIELRECGRFKCACLSDQHAITRVGVEGTPKVFQQWMQLWFQQWMQLWLVVDVDMVLNQVSTGRLGSNRHIGEIFMLDEEIDRIQTETIHTLIQPEAEHGIHGFNDFWVAPIQIRLLVKE